MSCFFKKYTLHFKLPGGTSRGVLHEKQTYIIFLQEGSKMALGECNRFVRLSYDDRADYEQKLYDICNRLSEEKENLLPELREWPSIRFGVETILKDWQNGAKQIIFPEVIQPEGFTIPTNGLVWMSEKSVMKKQIEQKLRDGYTSIKLKIGAIDFTSELELIQYIRKQYAVDEVEIRLDANGAFRPTEAKDKLQMLSDFGISYIEQPIRAGQWQEMAKLCEETPIPIALDEELIGVVDPTQQSKLMDTIHPQLLILKLALIGGFEMADRWKKLIESNGGTWVITSALESNIGLNAIAQYTATGWSPYAQGLGTGQLYTNNFPSPYSVDAQGLHYQNKTKWDFSLLW